MKQFVRHAAVLLVGLCAGCAPAFDVNGVHHGTWQGRLHDQYEYQDGLDLQCGFSLSLHHAPDAVYPFNQILTGSASFDWMCFLPQELAPLIDYSSMEVPLRGHLDRDGMLHLNAGVCPGELLCMTLNLEGQGDDADQDGKMDHTQGQFHLIFQLLNMPPLELDATFNTNLAWTAKNSD